MSLKDEILGEMIKADNNGSIHSSNYGKLTNEILKLFEKRIDSLTEREKNNPLNNDERLLRGYLVAMSDIKKELLK